MTKSPSEPLYKDDLVARIQEALWRARRTCINCVNFDLPTEGCALAQGQRPPATTIACGCLAWVGGPPF